MKKNGAYVGVDEKYIPEDEKYIDDSVNEELKDSINDRMRSVNSYVTNEDNQEKIINVGRKGFRIAKGIGIGYLIFFGFMFLMSIIIFFLVISTFFKMSNRFDGPFGTTSQQLFTCIVNQMKYL